MFKNERLLIQVRRKEKSINQDFKKNSVVR